MVHEWQRGDYTVSTDKQRVDLDVVYGFLVKAYWCAGIPRAVVQRSIEHALVFGVYRGKEQVGFARVISTVDRLVQANRCDDLSL